jgi:two-component system chemotaxis response regulator CheY
VRFLIVDDSRAMRQYVRGILKDAGHSAVEEVASGFDAFKILAREFFDFVITDLNMPDINGLELIRFIRKSKRHEKTKIAVITNQVKEKTREKLSSLGVDGFVGKPFEPETLLSVISGIGGAAGDKDPMDRR